LKKNLFNKTLIIGLGLIGGSFAKALRHNEISNEIFGCDLDPETLDLAQEQGVINADFSLEKGVISDFDFIVIAAPLSAYEVIFQKLQNKISPNVIIIDLGSIKNFKIRNLSQNFIACHPIAGSDDSGFEHSSVDLFLGKKFIICSDHPQKNIVVELAKKIGATAEFMNVVEHDQIFALVSHLPQFLSFLTLEFSPKKIEDDFFKTAFRLDKSNPEIWEDIFKMNERNLEKFYMEFFDELEKYAKHPEKILQKISTISVPNFDENFLKENFTAIFFRALVVHCYLQIPQIKSFQKHAGQGFKDFTSIVGILNYNQETLLDLIKNNRPEILKIINSLS